MCQLVLFQDGVLLENARKLLSMEENGDSPAGRLDEEGFQRVLCHLSHVARHRPFNLASKIDSSEKEEKMAASFVKLCGKTDFFCRSSQIQHFENIIHSFLARRSAQAGSMKG